MPWSPSDMHPATLLPLAVALGLVLAWSLVMVETDHATVDAGGGLSYSMDDRPEGTLVRWEMAAEGPVDFQLHSEPVERPGEWDVLYSGENVTSADGAYVQEADTGYGLVFGNHGSKGVDVEVTTDLRYSTTGLALAGAAIASFLAFPILILAQAWRAED